MPVAIQVENLSKAYQLGEIGTGTISRDLERWFAKMRGKEDPYLRIGETNDRATKGTSGIVWSLKDINFEIQQGDAVGIIGRNGAGKSTLLKILSRVTAPTTGKIKVKGRIASLLEVGTGFHPELTGRENIFLNGAILGMRKKEIAKKFDEIVDFAGVERYIDTPVRRYSSGMYVRLAFAVAAHLESEILIVDEVLAVGDAEFQKKCLGKMSDVSRGEGRTVLFVSHDLTSVEKLCNKAVFLDKGSFKKRGETPDVLREYYDELRVKKSLDTVLVEGVSFRIMKFGNSLNSIGDDLSFEFSLLFNGDALKYTISDLCLTVYNQRGVRMFILDLREKVHQIEIVNNSINIKGVIYNINLLEGTYYVGLYYGINENRGDVFEITAFEMKSGISDSVIKPYELQYRGQVQMKYEIF